MQKIYIRQFMAIQEAEIELENALLLIGEQASGKSTIAKLVYFFKSLRQDLVYLVYEKIDSDEALDTTFRKRIGTKFYNFFGSTRHLEDFEIKYFYSPQKYIALSLHPNKSLKIYFEPSLYQSIFFQDIKTIMQNMQRVSTRKDAYELVAFQSAVRELENFTSRLFEDNRIPLFIPAGRNITVNYPEQFKLEFYGGLRGDLLVQSRDDSQPPSVDLHLMIKFLEQTERIKARFDSNDFRGLIADKLSQEEQVDEHLLELALDKVNKILKAEYKQDQFSEKIFFDETHYVHLNKASSGQQEVIRILQDAFLVLLDKEKAFRVIEEPEAHLYPMAQNHLIEMIAMMLNSTGSQVIITTHSPYILSIFNNLLFATRVVNKDEKVRGQVGQIIPESCWLDPKKCSVYFLKDGSCESIFNLGTGLIDQNHLDEISEELGADFDDLYNIYGESLK